MKNETIPSEAKNKSNPNFQATSTGCDDAQGNKQETCCQPEEDKKIKEQEGGGCEAPKAANRKTSCC